MQQFGVGDEICSGASSSLNVRFVAKPSDVSPKKSFSDKAKLTVASLQYAKHLKSSVNMQIYPPSGNFLCVLYDLLWKLTG